LVQQIRHQKEVVICIICVDLIKSRLTSLEALKNLTETIVGKELDTEQQKHVMEVLAKIEEKSDEEAQGQK